MTWSCCPSVGLSELAGFQFVSADLYSGKFEPFDRSVMGTRDRQWQCSNGEMLISGLCELGNNFLVVCCVWRSVECEALQNNNVNKLQL